jgi:ornithine--oxo-acid transaminase
MDQALNLLDMNVRDERCLGAELFTADGRRILDVLSGYCVHNVGHNHPAVIAALREELESRGPAMLQTVADERAGELGERLCRLAGGRLTKVFFGSSGSEGVEATIKFSRAHTGRERCCMPTALSLGSPAARCPSWEIWREGFGPLLPETEAIPFDDVEALERKLATEPFAAFFIEPVQSEAGIRMPAPDCLRAAQLLCRRYGTLLVLDEVQSGMYRTGPFLAVQRFAVDADMCWPKRSAADWRRSARY